MPAGTTWRASRRQQFHAQDGHPQRHLRDFRGILQADAFGRWNALYDSGRIVEAARWAHARRPWWGLYEQHRDVTGLVAQALRHIQGYMPSKQTSAVTLPRHDASSGRHGPVRCWRSSNVAAGCADPDVGSLLGQLKKLPGLASAVAVAASGFGRVEDEQRSLVAGFDLHLGKPLAIDVLEAGIQGLLERREQGHPPPT
ncbi:transposase [Pelomonas sp. KK5]|uniref:IS66 family transposase n=1 Tax=Pelomonas sp. KK5 TaxID=1855730 RepID=UPI00097BEE2D|nr:transposase [Pelomonas sp. KK5]